MKKIILTVFSIMLLLFGCNLNGSSEVSVDSVSFSQSGVSMLAGTTYQLEPVILPEDATNQNMTFSSANTAVAAVDEAGLLTAVAAGTATITVTTEDGGLTADFTATVTVLETEVGSVSLDKSSISLITGSSETLTARILPTSAINKNLSWSITSTNDAATISDSGATATITGSAVGDATVIVTTEEGGFTATCAVSVVPTHSVTFNANGGTGSMAAISSGEGFTETLPASTMTAPANSVFGGWVTDPDADTAEYTDAGEITFGTQDIVLYAFWDSYYTFTVESGEVTITGLSEVWDQATDLSIPSSIHNKPVVKIAEDSFHRDRHITSVVIPDSVIELERESFWDCDDLTTISIGAGVETMNIDTFHSCDGITTITIAAGNTNYNAVDNVVFNEDNTTLIKAAAGMTGSYTVPGTVTRIEQSAFQTSSLTSVTLPASGLSYIGNYTFRYSSITDITIPEGVTQLWTYTFFSSSLQTINLPASLTSLRHDAFRWTWDMQSFSVASGNTVYSSSDGVLYNATEDTLIWYPLAKDISTASFPSTLTTIGEWAFEYCRQQTGFTVPEGVTTISNSAFYDASFTSISLPSTLTEIRQNAFWSCNNLNTLMVNAATPPAYPTSNDPLSYTSDNLVIYVPAASVDAYKAATGWSDYADQIEAIIN